MHPGKIYRSPWTKTSNKQNAPFRTSFFLVKQER